MERLIELNWLAVSALLILVTLWVPRSSRNFNHRHVNRYNAHE